MFSTNVDLPNKQSLQTVHEDSHKFTVSVKKNEMANLCM